MDTEFRVKQIDHVELVVPDRYEAARWYESVLGLAIIPEFEFWADDPGGPLMISTADGGTKLALFAGEVEKPRRGSGHWRVAFLTDGAGFLQFLGSLENKRIVNAAGSRLTADQVVDHERSYSIYFVDPYGYNYELTTYDHDIVADSL